MTAKHIRQIAATAIANLLIIGCATPSQHAPEKRRGDTLFRVQPIQLQAEDDMNDLVVENERLAALLHELARMEAIHHYALVGMSHSNKVPSADYISGLQHFDFDEYKARQRKLEQQVEKRIRDIREVMAPCACGKCISSMYNYVPSDVLRNPLKNTTDPEPKVRDAGVPTSHP